MVFIEDKDHFYDTTGFIEHGQAAMIYPPYFRGLNGATGFYELEAVGCWYLAPAWIYKNIEYYSLPFDEKRDHPSLAPTGHTDHWPVMCEARARGLSVGVAPGVKVYHADLPKYGEEFH